MRRDVESFIARARAPPRAPARGIRRAAPQRHGADAAAPSPSDRAARAAIVACRSTALRPRRGRALLAIAPGDPRGDRVDGRRRDRRCSPRAASCRRRPASGSASPRSSRASWSRACAGTRSLNSSFDAETRRDRAARRREPRHRRADAARAARAGRARRRADDPARVARRDRRTHRARRRIGRVPARRPSPAARSRSTTTARSASTAPRRSSTTPRPRCSASGDSSSARGSSTGSSPCARSPS